MKNRDIHIFSFVAALLMLATFSACEADDKIVFVTGTTTEPESELNKENGHEWVDLGLSVKWATCNVGASYPKQGGGDFAWGETIAPKSSYDWRTYKWIYGSAGTFTKYNTRDNKTQLELIDDAAHINWGGNWRMPTYAEMIELRNNCTWKWTTQDGADGYKVTSKSNGNSIFLPAAGCRTKSLIYLKNGYYWSSSLDADDHNYAYGVYFDSCDVSGLSYSRYDGLSIRPVLGDYIAETSIPIVATTAITQITETSAVAGGNVTSDGGASVIERGVVYSTNPNPVITNLSNTIRPCGSGTGEFTYTITNLQPNTTYYLRAYAKNDAGTAYGEEVSFTTETQSALKGSKFWPIAIDGTTADANAFKMVGDFRPDDVGKFLCVWDSTYVVNDNPTGLNFHGNTDGYTSLIVSTMGWAGCAYCLTETDASNAWQAAEALRAAIVASPDDYYLHMALKSTDAASHCFYIFGSEATKFVIGSTAVYDGPLYEDFTRNGEWAEFDIPMSRFATALAVITCEANMNIFVALTEGVAGAQLNMDAIYFYKK